MRKFIGILLILAFPALVFSQLKKQSEMPEFSNVGIRPSSNVILGFLNPEKFSMHHTFSMGFMSMGRAGGMMVNSYMNTINYQISNPLFLRLNLGLMNTPYNSFNNAALNDVQFFGGAELFYRPSENSLIKVGVDVRPGYYGPAYYNNGYGW